MNLRRPNFLGWMNDAVRPKSQKKFVAALNKHLGHPLNFLQRHLTVKRHLFFPFSDN